MRVVVTGAGGLIGWHLVEELARRGDDVSAWVRGAPPNDMNEKVEVTSVDISDAEAVSRQLAAAAPELVYHLAAQSSPGKSWAEPLETLRTNVGGTINLLEAARNVAPRARLLIAGSSAEYADEPGGKLISEATAIAPNSPYGVSKQAAWQTAQLYARHYGLDVVAFRPFLLVGPRKAGDVCSDFARRIVAIEQGRAKDMPVGALDVVRDFMDIRDGIAGLLRIAESGKSGEVYNVASGKGLSIRDMLEGYRALAKVSVNVVPDPALARPLDQKVRIGDSTKLRALGWQPTHGLTDTLRSVIEYWRVVDASRT